MLWLLLLAIVAAARIPLEIIADLPPHCLHGDVLGTWDIYKGYWYSCSEGVKGPPDPLCGFDIPDRGLSHGSAGVVYPNISSAFHVTDVLHLRFTLDRVIPVDDADAREADTNTSFLLVSDRVDQKTTQSASTNRSFDWTIVYDEGVDFVYLNIRYFAYFKYVPVSKQRIRSYCSTTMTGWWVPEAPEKLDVKKGYERGCWWGLKKRHENGTVVDPEMWTNEIAENRPTLGAITKHDTTRATIRDVVEYVLRHNRDGEANSTIYNAFGEGGVHLQWKPVTDAYVSIRDEDVTTLHDLNRLSGLRRGYSGMDDQELVIKEPRRYRQMADREPGNLYFCNNEGNDACVGMKHLKTSTRSLAHLSASAGKPLLRRRLSISSYLPLISLPVVWKYGPDLDWTNPAHVEREIGLRKSMVPDVLSQGKCGSCYAVSTSTMLTSRLWILHKNDPEIAHNVYVSEFPLVHCTPYSQGCDGGYIYLGTKYAAEHGLPTKECINKTAARFPTSSDVRGSPTCFTVEKQTSDRALHCGKAPPPLAKPDDSCRVRVKAVNWRYIGGAYGKSSEMAMREALRLRGPIAASFEPSPEFPVYKSGVFHTPVTFLKEHRPGDDTFPWEKVDHAVVIVGYGISIDPLTGLGLPYWKVMNSWGPHWGENGFFRIVRGVDELGIESIAVEASPHLLRTDERIVLADHDTK